MSDNTDPYAWMRDKNDPRMIEHLKRENQRSDEVMAPIMPLAQKIFREIVERTPAVETTVPYRYGSYEYSLRYDEGSEYPRFCRRLAGSSDEPEVLLDYNEFLEDSEFLDIQTCVNRQSTILAFAVDRRGDCIHSIHFRDLASKQVLPYRIPQTTGNMAWSKDGRILFYSELDAETLRPRRIKRYVLGTDPSDSQTVFDDDDESFWCYVYSAKSEDFILIRRSTGTEDEVRFIPADDPFAPMRLIEACRPGLEYDVQHDGSSFVIRTNLDNPNFRIMTAPTNAPSCEHWVPLFDAAEGAFLEDFDVLRGHVVLKERIAGNTRGRVVRLADRKEFTIEPDQPLHAVELKDNVELDTVTLRYEESSYVRFTRTIDYNVETGKKTILKEERVLGSFDQDAYVAEQRHVARPDGVSIPLTLLYRKEHGRDPRPVLLHGYGAYGLSIDPEFWLPRFSLLDRGFIFAIAHVRGGGEFGRAWHDAGRCHGKPNSVADFIACAEYLDSSGIAAAGSLYAMGESAGGFLVGAALNERPELFRGAVMVAPFVDVLNSLSDPTLPLTTTDFTEWGDPSNAEDYDVIRACSPYDNVRPQCYPHILSLSRLNDTQVAVWEPAKWQARIRDQSTSQNLCLLKTELNTGHMGRSGRHTQFGDTAVAYAFIVALHEGRFDRID